MCSMMVLTCTFFTIVGLGDVPKLRGTEILENKNNIYDVILRTSKVK